VRKAIATRLMNGVAELHSKLENLKRISVELHIPTKVRGRRARCLLMIFGDNLYVRCPLDIEESELERVIIEESLAIHSTKNILIRALVSIVSAILISIIIFGLTKIAASIALILAVVIFSILNLIHIIVSNMKMKLGLKLHKELLNKESMYRWYFNSVKGIIISAISESKKALKETIPMSIELCGMTFRSTVKKGIKRIKVEFRRIL